MTTIMLIIALTLSWIWVQYYHLMRWRTRALFAITAVLLGAYIGVALLAPIFTTPERPAAVAGSACAQAAEHPGDQRYEYLQNRCKR